jgi:hypothetical protein
MKKLILIFLLSLIKLINTNSTPNNGLGWYENLPAVAMDYKVHIDAGKNHIFMFR